VGSSCGGIIGKIVVPSKRRRQLNFGNVNSYLEQWLAERSNGCKKKLYKFQGYCQEQSSGEDEVIAIIFLGSMQSKYLGEKR
jgi:hypothetical protein